MKMLVEGLYARTKELSQVLKAELYSNIQELEKDNVDISNIVDYVKSWTDSHLPEAKKLAPETEDFLEEQKELENTLWYLFSPMVQMTLPHKDTKQTIYTRTNGLSELTWQSKDLIPFGVHARLILIYVCSMVVKYRTREIRLGTSKKGFATDLGLTPSGPGLKSIMEQLNRLRSAQCTLEQKIECMNNVEQLDFKNLALFSEGSLEWNKKSSSGNARLVITQDFYDKLIYTNSETNVCKTRGVPLNMNIVLKLKSSSFALDLYTFLTYRSWIGKKSPRPIPWEGLAAQFGTNYSEVRQFKADCIRVLKKVLEAAPHLNVKPLPQGLLIISNKHLIRAA